MDLWAAEPWDARPAFAAERAALRTRLGSLHEDQWQLPTAAPGWSVKDVVAHLLQGDLGRLSSDRDGDPTDDLTDDLTGDPPGHPTGHPTGERGTHGPSPFADALDRRHQEWVEATRPFSAAVLLELLDLTETLLAAWTPTLDLRGPSRVSWAADVPVPRWLDLARELTETWVHHQQVRHALGLATDPDRLPEVLRTLVWALPHQYRVDADPGTTVLVDLGPTSWNLRSEGGGRWSLEQGEAPLPAASVFLTSEAAWRSLTGAALPPGGVLTSGPRHLVEPVLDVRGLIA